MEIPDLDLVRPEGALEEGGRGQRDNEGHPAAATHPGADLDVLILVDFPMVLDVCVALPVEGEDVLEERREGRRVRGVGGGERGEGVRAARARPRGLPEVGRNRGLRASRSWFSPLGTILGQLESSYIQVKHERHRGGGGPPHAGRRNKRHCGASALLLSLNLLTSTRTPGITTGGKVTVFGMRVHRDCVTCETCVGTGTRRGAVRALGLL